MYDTNDTHHTNERDKEMERIRFGTTLAPDVVDKLGKMAPYFEGGERNDVIEKLVRDEWERRQYEMESKKPDQQ